MTGPQILHASCITAFGRGLLLRGRSGSGKSSLALALMALGAELVADDRVVLECRGDHIVACAPPPLRGLIEARGLGLLNAAWVREAPVRFAVDLDQTEPDRMPPPRHLALLGHEIPLFYRIENIHFASMLMQLLKAGRYET